MKFSLFLCLACIAACNAFNWQGHWAMDCDFPGKDFRNKRTPGADCSNTCKSTSGCTHFAWTSYNGGTCWMKQGGITKSQAVYKRGAVCGIISEAPTTGGGGGGDDCTGPTDGALGGGCETGTGSELVKGPIVWQDEFDYSGEPSTSKWEQLNRGNNPNAEKEFYTNGGKNAQVSGGNLIITAKKENYNGHKYTSARLHSKQYFKYGIFEMRAKLPAGRGQWPAFWLIHKYPMSWPRDGEIDIMEHVGFDPNTVVCTIHCDKYNHVKHTEVSSSTKVNDPQNTWHTYTVDWTPNYIKGYVDGRNYYAFDKRENTYEAWPFDSGFMIILNTAVGGAWGGQRGIDDNAFPTQYVIDYVRVYDNGHTQIV